MNGCELIICLDLIKEFIDTRYQLLIHLSHCLAFYYLVFVSLNKELKLASFIDGSHNYPNKN